MKRYIVEYRENINEAALNGIKEILDVTYVNQMMSYLFINITHPLQLKYLDTLVDVIRYEESLKLKLL